MNPRQHPAAEREADAAVDWYAKQSLQVAIRFLEALRVAYRRAATNPKQFPHYLRRTRRVVLTTFPYSIVFRELPNGVEIIAVAHAKRKPGYWSSRLKSHQFR